MSSRLSSFSSTPIFPDCKQQRKLRGWFSTVRWMNKEILRLLQEEKFIQPDAESLWEVHNFDLLSGGAVYWIKDTPAQLRYDCICNVFQAYQKSHWIKLEELPVRIPIQLSSSLGHQCSDSNSWYIPQLGPVKYRPHANPRLNTIPSNKFAWLCELDESYGTRAHSTYFINFASASTQQQQQQQPQNRPNLSHGTLWKNCLPKDVDQIIWSYFDDAYDCLLYRTLQPDSMCFLTDFVKMNLAGTVVCRWSFLKDCITKACERGVLPVLQKCLQMVTEVEMAPYKCTLSEHAVRSGHLDIVAFLIAKDYPCQLHRLRAVEQGNLSLIELFYPGVESKEDNRDHFRVVLHYIVQENYLKLLQHFHRLYPLHFFQEVDYLCRKIRDFDSAKSSSKYAEMKQFLVEIGITDFIENVKPVKIVVDKQEQSTAKTTAETHPEFTTDNTQSPLLQLTETPNEPTMSFLSKLVNFSLW